MRIASSQMFDRPASLMATLSSKADALQTQVATGKKIQAPSGDPSAWRQLDALKRESADQTAITANITMAQSVLSQADSTLESVETQMQRVQELAIQAANGTLSDANRAAIATSLSAIADDLLALANTKDVRGQPLFGGASGDAAFVRGADGSIAYAGSGEPAAIPIGGGNSVQPSVTGDRAFGDVFATIKALSDALATGTGVAEASATALTGLKSDLDGVAAARASIGARGMRLDLEADRLGDAAVERKAMIEGIEETDIPATIAELQKTLTILQATQASFTKLSGLSLFDYLR